jgi:hypothetical protein
LPNACSATLARQTGAPDEALVTLNDSEIHIREKNMLETIVVVLVILWLLGMVTSTTMGGLVHILLVLAIVVIVIRVIQGRRL